MPQPIILDAAAVERLLPAVDLRAALEAMFLALAGGGATQPPPTLSPFPNGAGDFITDLGVLADRKVFGPSCPPSSRTAPGRW